MWKATINHPSKLSSTLESPNRVEAFICASGALMIRANNGECVGFAAGQWESFSVVEEK